MNTPILNEPVTEVRALRDVRENSYRVVCAWCPDKSQDIVDCADVSHTICADCRDRIVAEYEMEELE
ncbi:MAG TPA: hypothetical protein VIT91_08125 [Chthoniobacterales bacterium]